ncbi:helix-turn-helix domain-containing protein [Thermodesulfobacteriota bacterium]
MISQDKRAAIYRLHEEGMGVRKIARSLRVNRGTVREIIEQEGVMPESNRKDKIELDPELLVKLHKDCNGWVQRIHEILTEEQGVEIGYSTLTSKIRELDLGTSRNKRSGQVPDKPGEEMQQDTSPYRVQLGDRSVQVQASLLYYRYSKIRYLRFYRSFNRFTMKCFLHEALTFWNYAADICIIDNTNLARLHGTGKSAVIVPEMEQFAEQYGFAFVCHEIKHSNRKAGNERGFFTVVTNFFAGRKFENMEDLNRQAFSWATVRSANRPTGKTRLIPAAAFEYEKPYLNKLPAYVEPPYLVHERRTDQYGYASFDGNFYWIPGTLRFDVKILQYSNYLRIYYKRELLGEYEMPPEGVKNEKIYPKGQSKPKHQPKYRKKPTAQEERTLRATSQEVNAYLNFAIKDGGRQKHRFIRELYGLHKKLAPSIFIRTVKRALKYRITDTNTIERIAILLMKEGNYDVPSVQIDREFTDREAYLDGRFAGDVDLSVYDKMMEEQDE